WSALASQVPNCACSCVCACSCAIAGPQASGSARPATAASLKRGLVIILSLDGGGLSSVFVNAGPWRRFQADRIAFRTSGGFRAIRASALRRRATTRRVRVFLAAEHPECADDGPGCAVMSHRAQAAVLYP